MKIGYMRTSTDDQTGRLQRDALEEAGCAEIFYDKGVSGAAVVRPQLDVAISRAGQGDELVFWRLDRLGRSMRFILDDVLRIEESGADVVFLTENLDTTTPGGRLLFHISAAFAEHERRLISDRTKEGMKAAKKAGRPVGRPQSISDDQWAELKPHLDAGLSIARVARMGKVSRQAIYRRIASEKRPDVGGPADAKGHG